tara:strand:+ start:314 stop:706 length:393 start_codon:yes stop_codon:yes gene_type:complete
MILSLITAVGSILGNDKVMSKGMDIIDDVFKSDSEKDRESRTEAKVTLMKSYEPFKVAQRWIALMFTVNFILVFWVSVVMWALDKDMAGFLELVVAFNMGWIMFAIVTFYFGGGMSESIGKSFIKTPKAK